MWKNTLGNDIEELNVCDLINALGINRAFAEKVEERKQQCCELLDKHTPKFSAEIKKTLEANPGRQEDDNPQQDRDSQATLPRENSQGERNGENNHNKKHRDSNPGRQEHDNRQQGKWKKKNPDSSSTAPRENRKGERNGENNHNKKHRDSNPGRQEHDNRQQGKWKKKNPDSSSTAPRENRKGERNGENNHNKKHRDSNPGRQEHDNRQQGKWKKKNPDSSSTAPRENRKGERNGENRLTENNRTPHQNANTTENNLTSQKTTQSIQQVTRSEALNVLDMDQNSWSATVNTNPITTLGENIKQKLQRNKKYIVPTLMVLLSLALWPSLNSWKKKNPKKVTTEQKDPIKRDSESETIDKVSATGELSHFVKEGESMYSIVTNLKSSWKLSGISSVREDIIRVACEKGFIMKIKKGQTTKEKFDPRDLSPGDVIVIKIKEFEDLHRQ